MRKEFNKTKEYISDELEKMAKEIVLITKDTGDEFGVGPDSILKIKRYIDNIECKKKEINIINKIKIGNYIKSKTSEILRLEFVKLNKYEKRKMIKIVDLITMI